MRSIFSFQNWSFPQVSAFLLRGRANGWGHLQTRLAFFRFHRRVEEEAFKALSTSGGRARNRRNSDPILIRDVSQPTYAKRNTVASRSGYVGLLRDSETGRWAVFIGCVRSN
jgi:hypothetical protein